MDLDLANLSRNDIGKLPDEAFRQALEYILRISQADRQEMQLLYYKPTSPKAERIHLSEARKICVGGGNGCLPLTAPILMADGNWRQLGEVGIGDMIIAANPDTGKAVPAPVTRVWRSGRKPVYRITFSDGGSFCATADHHVPLYLGSGRKTTKGNTKRPLKRRLGDYIEPIMRRGDNNPSKRIAAVSPSDIEFSLPGSRSYLPPYTLGALIGDGSLSVPVRFHNESPVVVDRVRQELLPLGIAMVDYGKGDWGLVNVERVGRQNGRDGQPTRIKEALEKFGLLGKNSYSKFIPPVAFGLPRHQRMELLAGLVDTDGMRDFYSTCSYVLAEGFEMLVRSLGGKATIHRRIAKCQNGVEVVSWAVYFRLNDRIPLCLGRKQAVNQRGRGIDYRRRICREAVLIGAMECGDIEVGHPAHCYVTQDYTIVSNSGKTENCIVKLAALATGILPLWNRDIFRRQFRGPLNTRIVLESLTTTLHPVILPKLQWWTWTGLPPLGGPQGHWGWIPKSCLVDGSWDRSWSEKLRTLTLLCHDPDDPDVILGESQIQFMSHDQDPTDFASGDFHIVLHDEPPSYAIWKENSARTMRADGTMMLAMTWPDDPSIPVDWIFDELYEKGIEGPRKDPNVEWIELYTTDNPHLNQDSVRRQMGEWSDEIRRVRIRGEPIRFSNRVHPLFTDITHTWCFACGRVVHAEGKRCSVCQSDDICDYNHVEEFAPSDHWPTVFVIDPHPRKPHMFMWAQVDPKDDYWVVADGELAGEPADVKRMVEEFEEANGLSTVLRLMDPNMGRSPSGTRREITWQDEFEAAGLIFDLADDSDIGRSRVNEYLRPDDKTQAPRLMIAQRCRNTVFQLKRFAWDDWKQKQEKDLKQKPRDKYDDYPAMLRYLMNRLPQFRDLKGGGEILKTRRRG